MSLDVGDLGENGYRLQGLVMNLPQRSTLLDVGVRAGVSSRILLTNAEQMGNTVWGIDIKPCPDDLLANWRYNFMCGESTALLNKFWPVHLRLAVLDTLHIAEQVMAELRLVWPVLEVGGWVCAHDCAWPEWKHDHYLGKLWDRPEQGVERFFAGSTAEITIHPESYGMAFIRKVDDSPAGTEVDWPTVLVEQLRLAEMVSGNSEAV